MKKKNTPYIVPALERGMRILEFLADHPAGESLAGMGKLGMPTASLYRMLVTLVETGYVLRVDNDVYRLSRKLLSLGYKTIDESDIIERAYASVRTLRDLCGETVTLSVLYENEGVIVDQAPSSHAVQVTVRVGHHFPLHTAAPAKAILAFLPEKEQRRILGSIPYTRFTPLTIPDAQKLHAELKKVHSGGIAFDRGEEIEDLRCVSAPILNPKGYPVAALCISGPSSRLKKELLVKYGKLVRETASDISLKFI